MKTYFSARPRSRTWLGVLVLAMLLQPHGTSLRAAATPAVVQANAKETYSGTTSSLAFSGNNTAGNLIVVFVVWNNQGNVTISDSRHNTYASAVGPTTWAGTSNYRAQLLYARNIAGGTNTITATFQTAINSFAQLYIHEYSGIDPTSPLDVSVGTSGTSSAASSGSIPTTNSTDLIFGAGASTSAISAGAGFATRSSAFGNVTADRSVTSTGSYAATGNQVGSFWVMQMAAFKAAGSSAGNTDTSAPAAPTGLSATAVSASQINLSWTAASDNIGVTGYKVSRNGTQVSTSTTTTYSDTGLTASTPYTYTVAAYDAAGNTSAPSTSASATTQSSPFNFSLSNAGNKSVTRGSSVQNSVTASLIAGTPASVSFSVSGLPSGVTAAFSPTACTPTCNTTLTLTTTASTPVGTSAITVSASGAGVTRTSMFSLTVTAAADTTSPTVSMNQPADNAVVSGTSTAISAAASDDVGVVGVQFLLDNTNLGSEVTTAPYSINWDTTVVANGTHVLSARARDAAGNSGSAANVTVIVDNQTSTGTGTPTLIQHISTGSNTTGEKGNAFVLNLPNPTLANNALIIGLNYQYAAGRTITITDNVGSNTYVAGPTVNDGTMATSIVYALGVKPGTQKLTVRFDTSVYNFQAMVSEFYNVATVGAFDGSSAGRSAAPSVSAGTLTTTADGDLIYQYAVNTVGGALSLNSKVTAVTAGTGFQLLSADRVNSTVDQYRIQAVHGSVNPTVTVTIPSYPDPFNSVSIALKSGAAGTAPSPGIRIVHVYHTNATAAAAVVNFPSTGNLIVAVSAVNNNQNNLSSVTDSKGNPYFPISGTTPWTPQMYYAPNANASPDMTLTLHNGYPSYLQIVLYDIAGADTAPFQNNTANSIGTMSTPQQNILHAPVITPTRTNSLIIASLNMGTGPPSDSIGSSIVFDAVYYSGQTDATAMDAGDGYAHIYSPGTSPIDFGWKVLNNGTLSGFISVAAEFKAPQ